MSKIHFITKLVCLAVLLFSGNVWAAFTCGVNPSTTVEVGEEYTFWFDAGMVLPSQIDMRAYLNGSSTSYTNLNGGQQYWDKSITPTTSATISFAFKAYDNGTSVVSSNPLCTTSVTISAIMVRDIKW